MRITRDRKARTITLDQELYVTKALERFGMDQCKPAPTPGVPGSASAEGGADSDSDSGQRRFDKQLYQEIVGTLMYSAISCRPDIAHAVQQLCSCDAGANARSTCVQLSECSATSLAPRILGLCLDHVKVIRWQTLVAVNAFRVDVCAYADADWANDKTDRKSITGWVAKLNGDPISWASKKQRTVAQSTCEAELYAEAAAIQEVLWLRGLLKSWGCMCSLDRLCTVTINQLLPSARMGSRGRAPSMLM